MPRSNKAGKQLDAARTSALGTHYIAKNAPSKVFYRGDEIELKNGKRDFIKDKYPAGYTLEKTPGYFDADWLKLIKRASS